MATKPILFSTPMVQALLDGRKTMTRRVKGAKLVNADIENYSYIHQSWDAHGGLIFQFDHATAGFTFVKPQFNVNDILWVRETSCFVMLDHASDLLEGVRERTQLMYKASIHPDWMKYAKEKYGYKWQPSIFMPREAARIFLKVTDIKIERLQDISEDDAIAEGCEQFEKGTDWMEAKFGFQLIWQSINGKDSWKANPWVIAYTFMRVEKPSDF